MAEELNLTMEALEDLYRSRRARGWDLRVYDYSSNTWLDGDRAFHVSGTYELAVLAVPGGRPLRVRVMPPGTKGLSVDAASAGKVALWRTLGIDLRAPQVALISRLLEGRHGPVPLREIADLLEGEGEDGAAEARDAIMALLSRGGDPP